MNRFITRDNFLEQTIKQVVSQNFPAVDIASLGGPNVESFAKNSMSKALGGLKSVSLSESDGSSKRLVLMGSSRWAGQHVVK